MNYADSSKLTVKRMVDIAGGLVGCLITLLIMITVGPVIYHKLPRSNLLLPEENRPKRKKIQDVQIPKHVHGRRSPKKRTHVPE